MTTISIKQPLNLEPYTMSVFVQSFHLRFKPEEPQDNRIEHFHVTECPSCESEIWLPDYDVTDQIFRCNNCGERVHLQFEETPSDDKNAPASNQAPEEIIEN